MEKELQKDGLKVIGLMVLLSLFSYIIPFFSFLIYIILPIPIVYFIVKHDIRESIILITLVALLNTAVISMIVNIPTGIIMGMYSITGFGIIGFFLGSGLKERFSPFKTLIMTIIAAVISNLVIIYSLPYIMGFNYQELLNTLLEQDLLPADYSYIMDQSLYFMKLLLPAIILISSIFLGAVVYYLSTWYLKKQQLEIRVYKPLKEWSFPRWWLSLALLLILFIRTYLQYNFSLVLPEIVNSILINSLVTLVFLFFLQGLAVMFYYLSTIQSAFLKMGIIFLIFFLNFILFYLLAVIGFIDMWFNLRKYKTE